MIISDKLILLRHAKGVTQEVAAKGMKISRESLGNWENGRATPPLPAIDKICKYYNIHPGDLFGKERKSGRFAVMKGLVDLVSGIREASDDLTLKTALQEIEEYIKTTTTKYL